MQTGFVLKNSTHKAIYDGDPYDLVFAVDPQQAKDYREKVKSSPRKGTLHVVCFGETMAFSCLVAPLPPDQSQGPDKELIDVSEEFFDDIQRLISEAEITVDRSVVWRKNFFRGHKVYVDPNDPTTPIFHQLVEKDYATILSPAQKKGRGRKKKDTVIQDDVQPLPSAAHIRIPFPVNPAISSKPEYTPMPEYRALLYEKKKQVLDGFVRITPIVHQGIGMPVGTAEEYDEPSITTDNQTRFTQIGSYANTLRDLGYKDGKMMRYHHRYLQNRQVLSKIYLGWITCIVAARRSGKTNMGSLIISEALFSERADGNPVTIVWVGINKKKNKTARNALRKTLKDIYSEGMLKWNNEEQSMSLIETVKSTKKSKTDSFVEHVKAVIYFVGAGDEEAGVGDSADLIIIDEVERIDKTHPEVIDDFMAIVNNEQARIVFISTLNWKSQKTRFYDWLKRGEADEMRRNMNGESIYELIDQYWTKYRDVLENKNNLPTKEYLHQLTEIKNELMMRRQYVGLRFTGEDIDIRTEQQKKAAKEQAESQNYDKYISERWSVFPNELKALQNIERAYVDPDKIPNRFPLIIFSYDIANGGTDNKTCVALGYVNDPESPLYNSLVQFREKELQGTIKQQIPQVIKLKNEIFTKYGESNSRNVFVYDGKGIGEAVQILFNMHKIKVNGIVKNHSGPDHKEGDGLLFYPSKTKMVEDMLQLATNGSYYISKECTKTINEHMYYEKVDNKGPVGYTYQAQKHKQDGFISAALMAVYFGYEILGLKIPIMKGIASKIIDFQEEFQEEKPIDYYSAERFNAQHKRDKMNLALERFKNPKIRF